MTNLATIAPHERAAAAIRIGDIFRRSRDLFAARWAPYCTVTALGYAPFTAFWAIAGTEDAPDAKAGSDNLSDALGPLDAPAIIGLAWFAVAVICVLLAPAIINFAAAQEMRGRGVSVVRSLTATLRRAPAIAATLALFWLGALAGAALFVIPGVLLFCMCSVAIPAGLAEGLGPLRSLSRSAFLTKGNRWRVFGILCVLEGGGMALGELMGSASAKIAGDSWSAIIRMPVDAAASAFTAVAIGVLYSALCMAREGVDIEHIAAVFD